MTEAKQNPCEAMIEETGYAEPEFFWNKSFEETNSKSLMIMVEI